MAASDEAYQHIEHGFEPVFDEHSRVLVLGSFPSVLSRANAFYYGNPQNRFWRVMAACLGAPVPPNEGDSLASGEPATLDASIATKRAMLLNGGVALWDVIESCDIKGSSDASIKNVVPAHAERITGAAPIEVVVCNGGTALQALSTRARRAAGHRSAVDKSRQCGVAPRTPCRALARGR